MTSFPRKQTGHSLVEYILPIALIGVMGGLFAWNDVFGETLRSWMGPALNASMEDRRLTLHPMGVLRQGNSGSVPFETTILTFTMANGSTLAVPGYPKDMAVAIETMGNNGTTEYLSDLMRTLAKELLDEGGIGEDQYDALMAMATQGERMAKQMQIVEEALAQWNVYDVYQMDITHPEAYNHNIHVHRLEYAKKIPVQDVDGNWVTLDKVSQSVGYYGPSVYELSPTLQPGESLSNAGTELASFLSLYQAADNSQALQDPAIALLMSHLVGEIVSMGEFVESLASAEETAQAVSVTRENANTICDVGGGDLSNGVQCI